MQRLWTAIGPAIIIAAVVLGPGSILTASEVGAKLGLWGLPIIAVATGLMMGMVTLSARLGVLCEHSVCTELARRLGRPVAAAIGAILFILVAIFQSSNNIAVIGGLEPLLGQDVLGQETLSPAARIGVLAAVNGLIIVFLYWMRDVYQSIERLMKVLIGVMMAAFLTNLVVVLTHPRGYTPQPASGDLDWLAMLGLIGTTFSVGGAFYQAYLVREKGWGVADLGRGTLDSFLSISVLGLVTAVVLTTSWRVFYGHPSQPELTSVGHVATMLEPVFGAGARVFFALGILAGASSSFLGNALVGGTVLSDSLGQGAKLQDRWPLHYTTAALLTGFAAAAASLAREGSTVHLITIAQALTIIGLPALAAALLYLGTRTDIRARGPLPGGVLAVAVVGLVVVCCLALLTVQKVWPKLLALFASA